MFFFLLAMACIVWLHITVRRLSKQERHIEAAGGVS
jgi:hypothetical protein